MNDKSYAKVKAVCVGVIAGSMVLLGMLCLVAAAVTSDVLTLAVGATLMNVAALMVEV